MSCERRHEHIAYQCFGEGTVEVRDAEKSGYKVGYVRFRLLSIPWSCKTRRTVAGCRSISLPMRRESS